MRLDPRTSARALVVAGSVLLVSCKGAEKICDPTDPLCGGGTTPTISSITVTSPIDSVMAVGRTVQMGASAIDSNGNAASPTYSWASLPASVASVSSTSGLVSGVSSGTATISAMAGGATGAYTMRVVNADLAGITTTLGDGYTLALVGALNSAPASTLQSALASCTGAIAAGNVLAVETCLANALATTGVDGNDTALLGVISLFLEHSQRLLQLGR